MNKKLYDKEVELPENYREHLKNCFHRIKTHDKDSEGYKRNKELQNQNFIGYPQLKRIKNFFDNFRGNEKEPEFILNGGFEMKNWVNDTLRKMRDGIEITNRNKMNAGMQNQFIDPHSKDGLDNIRPSKEHSRTVDKYNAAVTESLRRINEIMSKL